MIFSMPQYECKHNGKGKWKDVSESELLRDLNEFYGRVTPVIQKIIKGKHVQTPKAVYRLKLNK
jgi:hypothetical protein